MSKLLRLNYIGSKFQLLEWIVEEIKEKTGWDSLAGKRIADLFAGTGIVSYHFRTLGATGFANDAELYSAIITKAMTLCAYTDPCKEWIEAITKDFQEDKATAPGYITRNYSNFEEQTRMFFTVKNALRIDYVRTRLEADRASGVITHNEHTYLLACLLLAADAVSNVPAVYGCYLKNFKAKALCDLELRPIHTLSVKGKGIVTQSDVLNEEYLESIDIQDLVYLDPPYNERQYSKNYFPLNMIAKNPTETSTIGPLKGITGIPDGCFLSPFCKKGGVVKAFTTLVKGLKATWVAISYSSESLIKKDDMINLLKEFGEVQIVERDHKRFKSFEYNETNTVKEYLFFLKKTQP